MSKSNQSVIELVLELNNRLKAGFIDANKELDAGVGKMQGKLDTAGKSIEKDLRKASDSSKGLASSLGGLINPATLAVAGVGAVAMGLMKATDRAAEFNHEFRDLANLNLDKTRAELDSLRKLTLDTAWKKGFNASETTSAYEEIQSTIGLYGSEATKIVEQQGEFAKVMKADMGDYVAGTAKAMANWRFGVDRLEDFNKSAYATMQVGVVSFEQLAKVQSVYAGAASSVKQDFDTANKLFSLFTIRTKSVDEAATLTKSLFNDLTKKTTIDAFKRIGIDFYNINGELKQADIIMMELNKKFGELQDDRAIVALKNQFKGAEGLIAMIQAATDQSGELKKTLDEFSGSKMNFDNAMDIAHNDIVARQEKLANRIDLLIIKMGETMLPFKEDLVGVAETIVERVNSAMRTPDEKKEFWKNHERESVYKEHGYLITKVGTMSEVEYQNVQKALSYDIKKYDDAFEKKTYDYANMSFRHFDPITYFKGTDAKLAKADERTSYGRFADKERSKAFKSLASDIADAWQNKDKMSEDTTTKGDGKTNINEVASTLSDSLTRVVGSTQAPRNLTVNIEAFNKGGINTQNTSLSKMSADDIENWFVDVCMRTIRNVEMSY